MKPPRRYASRRPPRSTSLGLLVAAVGLGCTACHRAVANNETDVTSPPHVADASCPCAAEDSYFGINGTKLFHIGDANDAAVVQRLKWLEELNVRWDRNDLWWHIVEPEPDTWDFSRPDHVFDTFEKHDIHFYPILCYGAAWFTGGRTSPLPDDLDDYIEFVEKTVARYRDRVRYWEVWNEPNIHEFWRPTPDAAAYTKLLRRAYTAIKRNDPDALVCAPGIAPLGAWDRKFVETMYHHGAADHFDVFDYHYYRNHAPEAEVPAEIAEIKAVLRHYDRPMPIQISETGVTSIWEGRPAVHDRQAALIIRNQLLCLALGIDRIYYFDLQNWRDDTPNDWGSQLGLVTAAGEPKPAFYAYKTLIRETDCRTFIGRHQNIGRDVEAVLIYDQFADEYILALWLTAENTSREYTIIVAEPRAFVVDPDGTRHALEVRMPADANGGRVRVRLDNHPRYVHGVDPRAYLPEAGVRFEHALSIVTAGETIHVPLHIDPRLENAQIDVDRIRADRGLQWDQKTGTIVCDASTPPGVHTIVAYVDVHHGPRADRRTTRVRCTTRVEVVQPVALDPRLYLEGDALHCQTPVVNHTSRAWQDVVQLTEVGRTEPLVKTASLSFGPRQAVHVDFPIPQDALNRIDDVVRWRLRFGDYDSRVIRVYPALLDATAPTIDGELDDWRGTTEIVIDTPDRAFVGASNWSRRDSSAVCRVRFNADTLYVAADIRDNDPANNDNPPYDLWKGDSIEVFLAAAGPTRRTVIVDDREVHLALAPRHKGGTAIVYRHRPGKTLHQAEIATRKTAAGYTLEAAIPLTEISIDEPPQPGQLFGLDITLNDADTDADNPAHRAAWNGTARNWIDPSEYGVMVIRGD